MMDRIAAGSKPRPKKASSSGSRKRPSPRTGRPRGPAGGSLISRAGGESGSDQPRNEAGIPPQAQSCAYETVSTFVRALTVALVFAAPAVVLILGELTAKDPALWTHVVAGRAFVEEGARIGTGAEGWLFNAAVFRIYAALGLRGLAAAALLLVLATTAAVFALIRRLHPHFVVSALLTAAVVTVAWRYLGVSVHMLTLGLVSIELNILWSVRTGRNAAALGLPLLFVLWANLSLYFTFGLAILAFAVVEAVHDRVRRHPDWFIDRGGFVLSWIIPAFLVSVAGTLLTPLGAAIFPVAKLQAYEAFAASESVWMRAPTFRASVDWLVLALGIAGSYGLGKRGELRPFTFLLLAAAVFVSFHAVRESWCLALVGATLFADGGLVFVRPRFGLPALVRTAKVAALAGTLLAGAWLYAETVEADIEAETETRSTAAAIGTNGLSDGAAED